MAPVPLALPPALPAELLTYVLTFQSYPTTLIICQSRSAFLSSLLSSTDCLPARPVPDAAETATEQPPSNPTIEPPKQHPLLIPTLRQIATSRCINLVFVNTVSHLRAYLAAFPATETVKGPPETKPKLDISGRTSPLIVVYGLVALHRDTSEWSAQGLGSSFATLVEAGWRTRRKVVVLEEEVDGAEGRRDGDERPHDIWGERLPMLNGNVRRAGLEGEDAAWSGRTVEVRRVLGRWFKFRKGEWSGE